jgi:very-short-patch-repair endonuclease
VDERLEDRLLMRHARELRADKTKAERLLWSRLRVHRLGYKFRQQHPTEGYIADFACVAMKLIVEVDGKSHFGRERHDVQRTEALEAAGWKVVRYTNLDILDKIDAVVADIARHLAEAAWSGPSTSGGG